MSDEYHARYIEPANYPKRQFEIAGPRTKTDLFSPFVLADRTAFVVVALYFLFWPIWYVSEDKLSARVDNLRIEHLVAIVIFILSLGTLVRRWTRIPGSWALSLLIGYGAITLTWSVNVKEGSLVVLNLASVFIFAQVLARNPTRLRIARLSFLFALVLMAGLGLNRAEAPSFSDFRLLFPAGIDANQFAVQVALAVVILTGFTFSSFQDIKTRSFRFWGSLALTLSLAGVIILTGSRTGLLAVIIGSSLVLLLRKDPSGRLRISHRRLAWAPALALLGILAIEPLMASQSPSLLERYEEGFFRGDLAGRGIVWRAGAKYFASSANVVLIGGGLGSFDESVVDYLDRPLYQVAVHMAAANPSRLNPYFASHNDLLRVACDLGMVGLVLFVTFYVQVGLASMWTTAADHDATLPPALLATVIVGGMAIDLVSFPVYPIVLALIIAPCAGTYVRRVDSI